MTTTVFLILLICLLTMRFFTTCMIILLIGVFVMADQQAHAESAAKCDNPGFITLDSIYTRASVVCPVDYMDSQIGHAVHNIALPCWKELPRSTINNLIKKGFDGFNEDVKKNGKSAACKKAGQTQDYLIGDGKLPDVEQLISQERRLDAQCRGNGTDCVARQKLAWQLQNLGWCWGKTNQIGADMQWHKCTRDSQKMTLKDLHSYDDEIR